MGPMLCKDNVLYQILLIGSDRGKATCLNTANTLHYVHYMCTTITVVSYKRHFLRRIFPQINECTIYTTAEPRGAGFVLDGCQEDVQRSMHASCILPSFSPSRTLPAGEGAILCANPCGRPNPPSWVSDLNGLLSYEKYRPTVTAFTEEGR